MIELVGITALVALLLGGWLGWQLLRQNGRMLLRLDELEKRLDELEFGEVNESEPSVNGVSAEPMDAGAADGPRPLTRSVSPAGEEGSRRASEWEAQDRAARFSNRSLARSRIKRDGLKAGRSAPSFRLPLLDGGGELSLEELQGKRVLLVFSDPHCGPCNQLAPQLERFHREHSEISVVMISRGEPKDNRVKVKEHELTFPIVLQQQWEISRRYAMFATPVAYLIDEAGIILNDVAVGMESIVSLMKPAGADGIPRSTAEVKSEQLAIQAKI